MVKICPENYTEENEKKYAEHFAQFPYPLSGFQKYAIEAIVEGNHVLVTAHTGSGKTLPAEFAIQHFVGRNKKVVYCSPIKALSNQKYYEFTQKYPHITFGLFTGDIKTNPGADVLIMTTEILMNYLFKETTTTTNVSIGTQSLDFDINIQNELGCVVFDEVHYINDKERGGVWERSLMMLPQHIQLVMLSATIDNPAGFAEWTESGRLMDSSNKIVYLASTNKRVVPLSHYGYLTTIESVFRGMKDKVMEKQIRDGTNCLLTIQTEKGEFKETAFHTMSKLLNLFQTKQIHIKRQHVLNNLVLHLRDHDMLPAIAFVFSRKHVELCAKEITVPILEDDSKVSYIVRKECEQIIRKLPNYHEYLELPEYNELVALLEKGIGIHHSGMIPILREIVELMISKKYIKLLFATESFAIGLDCPIKTAIFTSLTKFDGNNNRDLLPHEYTQMAGRAGRRGQDTIGYVIHCNNLFPFPNLTDYKSILCGKPQKLTSKYHISYSLVLNLLKNGVSSNFHHFSEKSMVHKELTAAITNENKNAESLKKQMDLKRDCNIDLMKTPLDACTKYIELETKLKTAVNKKRKDIEKEMRNIVDEHKNWKEDINTTNQYLAIKREYEDCLYSLRYIETLTEDRTKSVCNLLIDYGFIEAIIDGENENKRHYQLLELGKIASNIAEVHPLIISKFMMDTNYFESFSVKQLIGLFSCFTDIKIPSDERASCPQTTNAFLKDKINALSKMYVLFQSTEYERDIYSGLKYDDALMYDMIDHAMTWCDCETEMDCKCFIQNTIAISIGDFNKAMMKIVTVTRELANVAEQIGQIELLHKLSQIEPLVLKYVATSQSLYV